VFATQRVRPLLLGATTTIAGFGSLAGDLHEQGCVCLLSGSPRPTLRAIWYP